jgi:hypothetical protein
VDLVVGVGHLCYPYIIPKGILVVDCFFSTYISSLTGFYLLVVFNLLGFNPYGIITHRFLNLLGIGENSNEILMGATLFVYLFE